VSWHDIIKDVQHYLHVHIGSNSVSSEWVFLVLSYECLCHWYRTEEVWRKLIIWGIGEEVGQKHSLHSDFPCFLIYSLKLSVHWPIGNMLLQRTSFVKEAGVLVILLFSSRVLMRLPACLWTEEARIAYNLIIHTSGKPLVLWSVVCYSMGHLW